MRSNLFLIFWLIEQQSTMINGFVSKLHPFQQTTSITATSSRSAIEWLKNEPFENLLPKADALAICSELLSSKRLIDESEALVQKNWEKVEERIQNENRSAKQILGEETTQRILQSVQDLHVYDSEAVRAFLGSDAINSLFAKVLYDGIYEFFETIDVFGNIISNLPVIGPVRNRIRDEIKRNLDRTLGPLVQGFLRGYTKVAVLQASDFVISPSNQKTFGNANVRLVSSILDRPLSSLLPPSEITFKLCSDAFDYIRNVNVDEVEDSANFLYELLGDKSVSKALDVDRIMEASPTLTRTIDRIWEDANKATLSATE